MLDVKDRIREYWNSRSRDYDSSPGHASLPEVWKEVLSEVLPGRMRVLDVGTGTGFLAILLAELGHEVVGVDLSEGMLRVAEEKAERKGLRIKFEIGDAENLHFPDESFDAVICRHLLWTLPNPEKAVEEWRRVVRAGGRVVAIDGRWHSNSPSERVRKLMGRIAVSIYERRNPFRRLHYGKDVNKALPFYGGATPENVVEIFRRAGLSDVRVRDMSWIRELTLKGRPFFYRLAWSGREYFLVEGFREV